MSISMSSGGEDEIPGTKNLEVGAQEDAKVTNEARSATGSTVDVDLVMHNAQCRKMQPLSLFCQLLRMPVCQLLFLPHEPCWERQAPSKRDSRRVQREDSRGFRSSSGLDLSNVLLIYDFECILVFWIDLKQHRHPAHVILLLALRIWKHAARHSRLWWLGAALRPQMCARWSLVAWTLSLSPATMSMMSMSKILLWFIMSSTRFFWKGASILLSDTCAHFALWQ